MKHLTVFLLMMCLALPTAVAQPGAELPAAPAAAVPAEIPLDVFLEQRVAEELAADGTILSRLGVALDIELVGPQFLVSLVDPATRRAVASTKLDGLPPDREAAVASVVQVAANLAAQLTVRATPESAAVAAALGEERRIRQEREDAEDRFRQEAVWFGDDYTLFWTGSYAALGRKWSAFIGEERRRLSSTEFYEHIGRPDLAAGYQRRRTWGIIGLASGFVALAGTGLLLSASHGAENEAEEYAYRGDFSKYDDAMRKASLYRGLGWGALGLSMVFVGAGGYLWANPHPVSEREAQDLGRAHNRRLREKYNLPVAVSPYVDGSGGGLSVAGRF